MNTADQNDWLAMCAISGGLNDLRSSMFEPRDPNPGEISAGIPQRALIGKGHDVSGADDRFHNINYQEAAT